MSISQNFPSTRPSLNLNFARSQKLDPRITFTRTSSATRTNAQGLIEVVTANTPRFEHSYNSSTGSVNSLGLLVEESRTNLITYSDYSSGNSLFNVTLSTNATTAPDGTNTAVSMTGSVGTSVKYLYKGYSTTTTGTYTTSVFAKYNGEQYILLRVNDNTGVNDGQQRFDILNGIKDGNVANGGTATGASSTITAYPNGWYRLSVTVTFNSALTSLQGAGVYLTGYTTTSSTNSVYLWGAQLEAGAFPTSYIPTVASTRTRAADNASITGKNFSEWYRQDEGTLLVEYRFNGLPSSAYPTLIGLQPGSGSAYVFIFYDGPFSRMRGAIVSTSNIGQQDTFNQITTPPIIGNRYKYIKSLKTNDFIDLWTGNNNLNTDLSGTLPILDKLGIGISPNTNSNQITGTISRLTYYPKRLPNAQLQALTS